MRTWNKGLPVLAASLLLWGSVAVGQANSQMSSTKAGTVSAADRQFMDKAAQGGMAEVELGQLAQQNGQSQQVKDFGKRMVDDHGKANDQLKQLASQTGVTLPAGLSAKDEATKDKNWRHPVSLRSECPLEEHLVRDWTGDKSQRRGYAEGVRYEWIKDIPEFSTFAT